MSEYFFGRYFKCVGGGHTVAFIPARHRRGVEERASLQIITDKEAHFFSFPIDDYKELDDGFGVRLGACRFEKDMISVDLSREDCTVRGKLALGDFTPVGGDVMGPFRFVPFMQCRHSVYSMKHQVNGTLELNGKRLLFDGGTGYIEGDRGRSFPENYLWTQAFSENGDSVMLSVATVPMGLFRFTGVIAALLISGKEYRIATYKGAKAVKIGGGEAVIRQKDLTLYARLIEKKPFTLYAPQNGGMTRTIRESASCAAAYRLEQNGRVLLAFETPRASFEYEYPE